MVTFSWKYCVHCNINGYIQLEILYTNINGYIQLEILCAL